jgi:hypothetical protein
MHGVTVIMLLVLTLARRQLNTLYSVDLVAYVGSLFVKLQFVGSTQE